MAEIESQYVRIQRAIWNKASFRSLSDDGKLLFLYLDTCPHGNMLGYFVMPPGYACEDLGWKRERFAKGLGELFRNGLIAVDETTHVILDLHHILKFPPENPNQVKAAISKFNDIPKNTLFQRFGQLIERLGKPFMEPLRQRLRERLGEHVEVEVKVEVEVDTPPNPPIPDKPKAKGSGNGLRPWPEDFVLTEHLRKLASEYIPSDQIETEWEAFKAYSLAHGKKYLSWEAAWKTRYINFKKYNPDAGADDRRWAE